MDDECCNFGLYTYSKQSSLDRPSDHYVDAEEFDDDDDTKSELTCPFCLEDFDVVGLCYHIGDEHPTQALSGICPLCSAEVDMDTVGHIIMKHENTLKALHEKKLHNGESCSTLSIIEKQLQDERLQSLLEGSSYVMSSSSMATDRLLLSFIFNRPLADQAEIVQTTSTEASLGEKSSDDNILERNIQPSPLLDKEQEEKAQRCKFVQELLFSTILDDNL